MSEFFNEEKADQQVICSLIGEIKKLRRELMPIVKTVDGKFYRVETEQEVTAEAVQAEASDLQNKLTELNALLAVPEVTTPAEPAAPEVPPTPEVNPELPVDVTPPAEVTPPADVSTEAPADSVTLQ